MKNKSYPLYEREEYESLCQMVQAKARSCADKIAFQYRQGNGIRGITYSGYFKDVLVTGRYFSEHYRLQNAYKTKNKGA